MSASCAGQTTFTSRLVRHQNVPMLRIPSPTFVPDRCPGIGICHHHKHNAARFDALAARFEVNSVEESVFPVRLVEIRADERHDMRQLVFRKSDKLSSRNVDRIFRFITKHKGEIEEISFPDFWRRLLEKYGRQGFSV